MYRYLQLFQLHVHVFICTYMLHMCVLFSLEGEDKMSLYCIIVLGVSTLGTSVLLWWLYKYFSGKDKYNVEGMYACMHYTSCVCTVCVCVCVNVHMYVCMYIYD